MDCVNKPEGDLIYLLDNLGFPIPCRKEGDKYVCTNVILGKAPVFDTSGGKCLWKLCDINTKTGEIDYTNCRPTTYKHFTEKRGDRCWITNFTKADSESMENTCCCDADSRCDYSTCCDRVPVDECGYKDFRDHFFNISYLQRNDRSYVCLEDDGTRKCTSVPDNYDVHPEWYPKIQAAQAAQGGELYSSSLCDCVKDKTACKTNVMKCQPKEACVACNPQKVLGDYNCVLENDKNVCKEVVKGTGNYKDLPTCQDSCGNVQRYSCDNGTCVPDDNGSYFSQEACEKACVQLIYKPLSYDEGQKISQVLTYISVGVGMLILILILFYVFSIAKGRVRKR